MVIKITSERKDCQGRQGSNVASTSFHLLGSNKTAIMLAESVFMSYKNNKKGELDIMC